MDVPCLSDWPPMETTHPKLELASLVDNALQGLLQLLLIELGAVCMTPLGKDSKKLCVIFSKLQPV